MVIGNNFQNFEDKSYGENEEYKNYIKKTPIILPLLPLYSVKKYKWLVA